MNRRLLKLKLNLCRHMIASDDAGVASDEDALFNDCYTTVLPPAGVHEVKKLLLELQQENRAIMCSTEPVRFSPTARARAFVAENS